MSTTSTKPSVSIELDPVQRPPVPVLARDGGGSAYTDPWVPPGVLIPFPPDHRARVDPTTVFPYQTIGLIVATFPSGEAYGGTGTLIGESYVLTCAHNLFSPRDGGAARSVTFYPARNGPQLPFPAVAAQRICFPEEYRSHAPPNPNETSGGTVKDYTQYLYDYGLVVLKTPVEDAGYLGMYAASDEQLEDKNVGIYGYPGDKSPLDSMWGTTDALTDVADEFLFYKLATYRGQSGSGVLARYDTLPMPHSPRIVGIHVAGVQELETNFAVRLTEDVMQTIVSWF